MRKPQDPRKHGLREPEKVHSKNGTLHLSGHGEKVSLEVAIGVWNKALKDHLSQGHQITAGPYLNSDYNYYTVILSYEYSWENLNYSVERLEYDATLANYEQEVSLWREAEAKREAGFRDVKDIDDKILRAERRLANLKAAKAGASIPYPEG